MSSKKILILAFVLVAFAQLLVPAKMIWDRERILLTGTEYKFKTAPVDPHDLFRGKYITLNYVESDFQIDNAIDWEPGEVVYVSLTKDRDGFARIKEVSKKALNDKGEFIKAKVRFVTGGAVNRVIIDYPFDRYYMEESKAYEAELAYTETQLDTTKNTYALVSISHGEAVLKDVLIDGIPIREVVMRNREGSLNSPK